MKKINLLIFLVVIGISVYSMEESTLIRLNVMERKIEKIFIADHSEIFNEGEPINCEVEVNLFEKNGVVRLIAKDIMEVNELVLKSQDGFFDEYFEKIVKLVKNHVKLKDYEVNLIFVSERKNKLIMKRRYTIQIKNIKNKKKRLIHPR